MRRLVFGTCVVTLGIVATTAFATNDPIVTRKKLMDVNGKGAAVAVGMAKGEIPFDPKVAEAVIQGWNSVAYSAVDYFPEGSDKGDTKASPKIWQEMSEFQEYFAKFQKDTDAALKSKPQDLDAFKAVLATVGESCKNCHEDFRLPSN
jgi:cytochrome c556